MVMIGPDELAELDQRLLAMFQTLAQNKKATEADVQAVCRFLEWIIYPEWQTISAELDIRPIQWSEGLSPPERESIIQVARAAAALARGGKDREKATLVEACEAALRGRGVTFGHQEAGKPQKVDRQTDARDKFIYQKVCKGAAARQVRDLIGEHPHWELVPEAEIFNCAVAYAQRHGLPLPRPGM